MSELPVLAHSEAIRAAVRDHRRLILSAPPGTGKSTQVPQLLMPDSGRAVVLQPRRLAARNLAMRVAAERGEALGRIVGYEVRHERARSDATRLLFATYGVFWQQLLRDPRAEGISLVILDEFHERTLEADACLAWVRRLQRTERPDLALVVMSATLEGESLGRYLDAPVLAIEARAHPVEISYQASQPQESLASQAARGLRHLLSAGVQGSILVFMPGAREIRRTIEAIDPFCQSRGLKVLELSGAQSAEAQQQALSLPSVRPCVIVSTNVAETSLTIPGIEAVIDSGRSREAAYDTERDLDTLHLGWISRQSATQRAGRAGRLGPGRCLRLWSKSLESSMPEAHAPEIERLDLSRLALACATLRDTPQWLTTPPRDRYDRALKRLVELGALEGDLKASALGRRLLGYPLPPGLARVLLAGQEMGQATLCAAMIAVLEGADRRSIEDEGDLYRLGLALVREQQTRRWDREVVETFRQLLRLAKPSEQDRAEAEAIVPLDSVIEAKRREAVTRCWLSAYSHRLAVREDKAFELADGRKGMVSAGNPAGTLLIALELHESGGAGQNRRVSIPLYLPIEPDWVQGESECVTTCQWDPVRSRVVQERHWRLGGLTLRRQALTPAEWDSEAAETLMIEKLVSGEAALPALDEDVEQLVRRIRQAAVVWPEAGIPCLDADDWLLLYHELCRGRAAIAEITPEDLRNLLRAYVGEAAMRRIDRAAPCTYPLSSGRSARITYLDDAPPELSARLGDMLGLQGTLKLFEGRVPVLFDILAPNYRTVQKTFDMTSFWQNTYPEVKRELKRRYPKHPWP